MKPFLTKKWIRFSALCLFFLLINLALLGQKTIYQLHSAVGDTIDSDELSQFLLFSDHLVKDVEYCLLLLDDNQFELHGFNGNDLQCTSLLSEKEVSENAQNIDKLIAYFQKKEEKDSINMLSLELQDLPVVEIKVDKDNLNKEIKQMNKQKSRRERDNDRHERVTRGMHMF
jgi:hypothetical protein